jgi:ketosteroid isomerase-like protein
LDLAVQAGEKIYGKAEGHAAAGPKPSAGARDAETLIRQYTEAFNRHDVEGMLALTDPNIEWLNVQGNRVTPETVGRSALRAAMSSYFQKSPSTRSVIEDLMAAGTHVTVRERAEWIAAGKTKAQRALAVYDVQDGLIRRVWYYPAYQ